jgi:L-lysine exporter family protein LysE/ArgO
MRILLIIYLKALFLKINQCYDQCNTGNIRIHMMNQFCVGPFLEGCGTGAGLIVAIGAQNAFVLKQGLMKNYVFITALVCALSDAILIWLGVGGLGQLIACNVYLMEIARWGGATFLLWYGFRSFRAVFKNSTLKIDQTSPERPGLKLTVVTLLMVCFLNPHVYLDAFILLGSIGGQFKENERIFFGLGAVTASFVWFFALCYGARYLAPLFSKPIAWKILDFIIGCIMWAIAITLILPSKCF